jgi:hypothetical protein
VKDLAWDAITQRCVGAMAFTTRRVQDSVAATGGPQPALARLLARGCLSEHIVSGARTTIGAWTLDCMHTELRARTGARTGVQWLEVPNDWWGQLSSHCERLAEGPASDFNAAHRGNILEGLAQEALLEHNVDTLRDLSRVSISIS